MKQKTFSSSNTRSAITAITCSVIYGILVGMPRMSSLLFVASMAHFGIDRAQASFPFFLCYVVANASGPLLGILGEEFGMKNVILLGCILSSVAVGGCFFANEITTLTVLWGVVLGIGFESGVVFLPQVLRKHFSSHLDKALGITVGGECITSFLFTFLTEHLLNIYGFSGTFLILSGVVLHSIPAAMLIQIPIHTNQNTKQNKVSPNAPISKCNLDIDNEKCIDAAKLEEKKDQLVCNVIDISTEQKLDSKSSMYGFRVFLNPTYILLFLTQGVLMYTFVSVNTILVDVSKDHGVSKDDAVNILIGFQVADGIGRFTLGFFTDRGYLSKANFSSLSFAAMTLLLFAFIWVKGFSGLMIIFFGLGVLNGGLRMISSSFVMQFVEEDCLSIAITSRYTLYTPMGFTQAPLIGFFRDKLRSYNGLICILIALCCLNSIVSFIIPSFDRWRQRRKYSLQDKQEGS